MDTDTEHIIYKDRKFHGLRFVDTDKITGLDIWSKVDQVMKEYTELHPNEVWLHLQTLKGIRDSRFNDTGSTRSKSLRWGLSLPMGMAFKIQALEPDFFERKDRVHKFMKRYKGFRACKNV